MQGPSPRRTCFIGNGRAFHATFSRLPGSPVRRIESTTRSCANTRLGRRTEPASAADVLTNCLRENLGDEITKPPAPLEGMLYTPGLGGLTLSERHCCRLR